MTGTYPRPPNYAANGQVLFDHRAQMAERIGFQYFYGSLPTKECGYVRYLLERLDLVEDRPVRVNLDMAEGRISLCYYLDKLAVTSASAEVYLKGDMHGIYLGILLAFNAMMRAIGLPRFPRAILAARSASRLPMWCCACRSDVSDWWTTMNHKHRPAPYL